jgi:hypothetical protein
VPAGPLRDLAWRVPADCRANMAAAELLIRVEYVHDLLGRAASGPEHKAERTRKLAEKALKSLSADAYNGEYAKLTRELADANLKGDSRAAYEAYTALRQLERANPPVPAERVVAMAAAAVSQEIDRLKIPPAPARNHLWNRSRQRRH